MQIAGRRFGLVLSGVLPLLVLILARPCAAEIIYSNLSAGSTFLVNRDYETNFSFMATSFVSTGQGNLDDVLTPVFSLESPVTFGLYTDSGNAPGALLESWTATVPGFPATLLTLPSVQNPFLSADTQYWFVITLTPAQKNEVAWYQNNQDLAGGIWAGDSLDAMLNFLPGSPIPAIQLNSTPEPAAELLLGGGLCGMVLLARSKRGNTRHESLGSWRDGEGGNPPIGLREPLLSDPWRKRTHFRGGSHAPLQFTQGQDAARECRRV
jgi:hypothetical protein